jgi:ubiquinone/menaquinone biosynthesis C-methylase UbiE
VVSSLAPFVPSRPEVVKRMLEIANVGSDDVVFDLGCGDGRILMMAVNEFNAKKAIGYEMRRDLYQQTLNEIIKQDLTDKISVINGDLLEADLSQATVITLYLTTSGNERLRPKMEKEIQNKTRIVSHDFSITKWIPSRKEEFFSHSIYLYIMPEAVTKIKFGRSEFSYKYYKVP